MRTHHSLLSESYELNSHGEHLNNYVGTTGAQVSANVMMPIYTWDNRSDIVCYISSIFEILWWSFNLWLFDLDHGYLGVSSHDGEMPRWIHNEDWNNVFVMRQQCNYGSRIVSWHTKQWSLAGSSWGATMNHVSAPSWKGLINLTHWSFLLCCWQCRGFPSQRNQGVWQRISARRSKAGGQHWVNAIKSTCLVVADVPVPLNENLKAIAKDVWLCFLMLLFITNN
jgi:hypothetical protein